LPDSGKREKKTVHTYYMECFCSAETLDLIEQKRKNAKTRKSETRDTDTLEANAFLSCNEKTRLLQLPSEISHLTDEMSTRAPNVVL